MISLVAFLGNCGEQYRFTRHNVAWQFADFLLPQANWTKKFKGELAAVDFSDFSSDKIGGANLPARKIFFLKPLTFMNLSGDSISEAAGFFKIPASEILVVHDELEMPFGTVGLKFGGGLGGHNGLRSAKSQLGTADFWRFRFGIGRPNHDDIAGYVLSAFSESERQRNAVAFAEAAKVFPSFLQGDAQALLKEWGKRKIS